MTLTPTKLLKTKTYFKSVSSKTATTEHSEGTKRADLEYEFLALDPSDLAGKSLSVEDSTRLAVIVNTSLVEFSKKLIAEKSNDWDFKPGNNEVTIQALYEDIIKPSTKGNRILSKVALESLAAFYTKYAGVILGKSEKATANGAKILSLKLVPIMGNNEALAVFAQNLTSLTDLELAMEKINNIENNPDSEQISKEFTAELNSLEIPLNAIMELIADLLSVEVGAADL